MTGLRKPCRCRGSPAAAFMCFSPTFCRPFLLLLCRYASAMSLMMTLVTQLDPNVLLRRTDFLPEPGGKSQLEAFRRNNHHWQHYASSLCRPHGRLEARPCDVRMLSTVTPQVCVVPYGCCTLECTAHELRLLHPWQCAASPVWSSVPHDGASTGAVER